MNQATLIYYMKMVKPIEGGDVPPEHEIVGIWDISGKEEVTENEVRMHSPKDAEFAKIYYISLN